MSTPSPLSQAWVIARLQLRRVFFSKRSFWVYLLAIFPSVIFFGHGLEVKIRRGNWANRQTAAEILESIREVVAELGPGHEAAEASTGAASSPRPSANCASTQASRSATRYATRPPSLADLGPIPL